MTIDEIITDIDAAKDAEPTLSSLNSPSSQARYKLLRYIIAVSHYTLSLLWAAYKVEVDAIASKSAFGTRDWFGDQVLAFQYGDTVTLIDYKPGYAVLDKTKQIVKKVSVVETNGEVLIKVAKGNGGGTLEPLTSGQQTALTSYVNKIKPAGVKTTILSIDADQLKFKQTITYNGQLDLGEFKIALKAAVEAYLSSIKFDGKFNVNKYIDALQAITGFVDVVIDNIQAKPDGGSYSYIIGSYQPASGYFKIDGAFEITDPASTTFIPA